LGDSATHKLIKYINKLINHAWPHSQEYGETLLNIGHISGGQARNILAKSACAQAIMRITKEPEEIILLLKAWAEAGLEITIKSQCEPFKYIVPEGFHSFIAGFGSDAPYLSDVAQGAILVGPGSLSLAHKEDEHISADEMVAGFEAYEAIAAFGREGDVAISNYTKNLCINVDDNS
jgi:acetylornithine deacetylase/succinyl-diaminopimelate desuccinylase-like protein